MRIAISGSHRTGKSTLLLELATLLPTYRTVDEPYRVMEEEGFVFSHPPSIEDFEAQLARSVNDLSDTSDDLLLDRCPIDILAYIARHHDVHAFDLGAWLPRVRPAVETLDFVVFVPLEPDDRIACVPADDLALTRTAVDDTLREVLIDDPYDFGVEVVAVKGDPRCRAETVLRRMRRDAG